MLVVLWLAIRRPPLRDAALLAGGVGAVGGFWLVRNLVETANPFYPVKLELGGVVVLDAPAHVTADLHGHKLLEYVDDPHVIAHVIAPKLHAVLQLPGELFAAGAVTVAGLSLLMRWRRRVPLGAPAAVAGAAIALALVYADLPYSALGPKYDPVLLGLAARYAGPALVLGAAATAWLGGRHRLADPGLSVLGLIAVVDGLSAAFSSSASELAAATGLVAAAMLLTALAWRRRDGLRGRAWPTVGAAALVLGGLALGGHLLQRDFDDTPFRGFDPTTDWIRAHAPGDRRVGVAGRWHPPTSPVLAAFGPRLDNRVAYVGPELKHVLRSYRRPQDFRAALRRGRYDLLLVGGLPDAGHARELRWASDAGFVPVARSPRFVLLRR